MPMAQHGHPWPAILPGVPVSVPAARAHRQRRDLLTAIVGSIAAVVSAAALVVLGYQAILLLP